MADRPTTVGEVDEAIRNWVIGHRNGALTDVMVNASRFGSTPSLIVMAVFATAWLAWRGRRADSLVVVVGTAVGLALAPLLKLVFTRPRPTGHLVLVDSWSFPSGHSLNSMVVLGLLTVLAVRERPGRLWRALIATLGAFLVFVVGFSRVYLGVHWPSDVLAGWLIGALWLVLLFTLARRNSRSSGTVGDSS
jgi:membrane-associated phospholipid phosphatase